MIQARDAASAGRRTGLGRQKLLAAVREVISEHGVGGLRVRRIAAAAGVSPPLVLYHYPDQASMMVTVHRDLVADYLAFREAAARSGDGPVERLRACAKAGLPPSVAAELVAPLFELHVLARRSEEHARLMAELWSSEVALYEEIIADGARSGVFAPSRPVSDVAASILAMEDGLALHLVGNNDELSGERALFELLHLAAAELRCPELESGSEGGPPTR